MNFIFLNVNTTKNMWFFTTRYILPIITNSHSENLLTNSFFKFKRSDIVKGIYEPTEEECDFPSDEEDEVKDLSTDMEGKVKLEESKP